MHPALPHLVIVRHGETPWTLTGQHTGRTDLELTAAGAASASRLAALLGDRSFAKVFTSPLKRARQTADLAGFGAVATPEPDLCEWHYGDYEGLTTAQIRAQRPDWRLFEHGCPNGETPDAVGARADRVIAKVQAVQAVHAVHAAADNVLLFAHSDILRVLTARWLRLPALEGRRVKLDTSSISHLGYDHDLGEPVIRRLNQAA